MHGLDFILGSITGTGLGWMVALDEHQHIRSCYKYLLDTEPMKHWLSMPLCAMAFQHTVLELVRLSVVNRPLCMVLPLDTYVMHQLVSLLGHH